ncbi:MAG: hypothetical protein ACYCYL_04350 [Acidithiobacillus sp.]
MRTITLPTTVTRGVFHVGLVASVHEDSSLLLINGLRELAAGLNDIISAYPADVEISNAHDLTRDLLDMEYLLLLMLEEARTQGQNINKQCSVSQLLDSLMGLRWEIGRRSSDHDMMAVEDRVYSPVAKLLQ